MTSFTNADAVLCRELMDLKESRDSKAWQVILVPW